MTKKHIKALIIYNICIVAFVLILTLQSELNGEDTQGMGFLILPLALMIAIPIHCAVIIRSYFMSDRQSGKTYFLCALSVIGCNVVALFADMFVGFIVVMMVMMVYKTL